MIKIAIIKPNHFDPHKLVKNDVKMSQFEQELKEYVQIVEINPKDFMQTILINLALKEKEHGDTEILWEKTNLLYQMCFNYETSGKNMEKDLNLIASFLSLNHTVINGTAVIFCDKINNNSVTEEHANVDFNEMMNLFHFYFFHQGLIITTDNKMIPVNYDNENHLNYQNHDVSQMALIADSKDNIGTDGHMLDFNFEIMVRKVQHDHLPVNKYLTKLTGLTVKGDALVKQKIGKDRYDNLDQSLMKKLLKLSEFDVNTRLIKESEVKEEKNKNLLPIIKNRYYILNQRLQKFQYQCAECKNNLVGHFYICGGCQRLKYCSQNCQKKHWDQHREECKKSQECFNCKVLKMIEKQTEEEKKK